MMMIRTWAARRKHTKMRKQRQSFMTCSSPAAEEVGSTNDTGLNQECSTEIGRPTLPKGTKLITFPVGHTLSSTQTSSEPGSQAESQGVSSGGVSGYLSFSNCMFLKTII